MRARRQGHVVNVSTLGVQTITPRFSAYLASKAALEAFTRVAAAECLGDDVRFTTVHMPLVRTPMSQATKLYDAMPALTPEAAGELICGALRSRAEQVGPRVGALRRGRPRDLPRVGQRGAARPLPRGARSRRAVAAVAESFTDTPLLTERFDAALHYATRHHARQLRKGTPVPYTAHLLAVASLVLEMHGDEDEAIAGLLHDVVEDGGGPAALAEIEQLFGAHVAAIVLANSDTVDQDDAEGRRPRVVRAQARLHRRRSRRSRRRRCA